MVKLLLLLSTFALASAEFANLHLNSYEIDSPPRSRIMQTLAPGNGSSIPAGGAVWPTAIYWTYVDVGTPPQKYPVAIDSGSGDLDIGAKGCSGCVVTPPNNPYDPASSSSAKKELRPFSNSYQTCDLKDPTAVCTISGHRYEEQVSLAGLGPVTVSFGAIAKQTDNFDQFKEVDGVMGFTMGGAGNVFATLVKDQKCDNVWAMCMTKGSKGNGTITIGGVDSRLTVGEVNYVPDSGRGFHSVEVAAINIGNGTGPSSTASIKVGKSAILDTGTNVLLLPKTVMTSMKTVMCGDKSLAHCDELWSNTCLSLTDEQVKAYPPLEMDLGGGVKLHMSSEDYLLLGSPLASSAGQYCLGIRDGGSAGGSGFIIGDTTMRNYYLVFDLAEKKIGWGDVDKANCGSV